MSDGRARRVADANLSALYRSIGDGLARIGALQAAYLLDGGVSGGPRWRTTCAQLGLNSDLSRPVRPAGASVTCLECGARGADVEAAVADRGPCPNCSAATAAPGDA